MNSIRVLIADDEPLARRGLEQLLAPHVDCQVVAACRNGRETVRALHSARPDVAFLDIQMPGLGGFDVLQQTTEPRPIVVFVTAYDEFAVRAFEEKALDYLLKPVNQTRFDRALDRVREQLRARTALRHAQSPARLVVPTSTGELMLDSAEIDWIQAEDYCAAVHARGRRHLIRESLNSLEQRLDQARFVRVHRSAIVRLDAIRELRAAPGGTMLVLQNGTLVPLSRRRRERVSALLRNKVR